MFVDVTRGRGLLGSPRVVCGTLVVFAMGDLCRFGEMGAAGVHGYAGAHPNLWQCGQQIIQPLAQIVLGVICPRHHFLVYDS